MQRTTKLFTVVLAITVMGSLFFVYRQLGATRHAPPVSVPDPRDRMDRPDNRTRDHGRTAPTVLSPDTFGGDMPAMISRMQDDELDRDVARERPSARVLPLPAPSLNESEALPVRPLPFDESLVPIPGPSEHPSGK